MMSDLPHHQAFLERILMHKRNVTHFTPDSTPPHYPHPGPLYTYQGQNVEIRKDDLAFAS